MRLPGICALLVVAMLAAGCGSGDGARDGGADDAGAEAARPDTGPAERAVTEGGSTSSDLPSDGSAGETSTPPAGAGSTVTTTTTVVGQAGPDVGDPYFPSLGNTGIDAVHYDLDLAYDPGTATLAAQARIDAVAQMDLASFDLDLVGLHVTAVSVDGAAAPFVVTPEEVEITLPEAVAAGTELHVAIAYEGAVGPRQSEVQEFALGWVTRPWGAYVAAEPDGARNWFPADDHPTDKATYTLAVTVPATVSVAATGLLSRVEDRPGGRRRWVYEARDPTAPYLVSVAVGDFTLTDPVPVTGAAGTDPARPTRSPVLRHALAPGTAGIAALDQTAAMLAFLEGVFGPYPFEVYGVLAVVDELGYALENQTLTLVGQDFLGSTDFAPVVLLHELAHQWSGNDVSVQRWADIWLNEGFATFAEWLWQEHDGGPTVEALAARAHQEASEGRLGPPLDPGPAAMFGRTIYVRGALALYALRQAVGPEVLSGIVRAWFARFGGASASTADFLSLVAETGGSVAAATVESWLTAPEVPPLP